jgi:hypothetical protein
VAFFVAFYGFFSTRPTDGEHLGKIEVLSLSSLGTRTTEEASETNTMEHTYAEMKSHAVELYKAHQWKEAMAAFRSAMLHTKETPQMVSLVLNHAAAAMMAKEYKVAASDCKLVLVMDPSNQDAKKRMERIKTILASA